MTFPSLSNVQPPGEVQRSSTVLVLTAAITPNVGTKVHLTDPQLRLDQYRASIAWWAEMSSSMGHHLMVVESTGAAAGDVLAGVAHQDRRRIEFINVSPQEATLNLGKGAVESEMIDVAIKNIGNINRTVYKITGRLIVANAEKCLHPIRSNSVRMRATADGTWVDTRVLGASAAVWRAHLEGMASEVNDSAGRYLEHVVAYRVRRANFHSSVDIERFRTRPIVIGSSGSTGKKYYGPGQWVRTAAFSSAERVFGKLAAIKQW